MTDKEALDRLLLNIRGDLQDTKGDCIKYYYQVKRSLDFLEVLNKYLSFRTYDFEDLVKKYHVLGVINKQQPDKTLSVYATKLEIESFKNWKEKA